MMNKKLKWLMQNLSDEQLSTLSSSNIDIDSSIDDEAVERIFKRTISALGISPKDIALERRKKYRRFIPVWSKIAATAVCIIAILSLSLTAICAANESFRESVFDILEYWRSHPEEKVKISDPDYKADLKKKIGDEIGITEQTTFLERIEFPVAEVVNFNDFDYDSINLITINNAMTGRSINITDVDTIERIIVFLKNISGSSPISNKGYSGGYYYIKMFKDDCEYINVGFVAGASDEYVFTYGTFEEVNGFKYACRYKMTGVETEYLLDFFGGFFE